MAEEKKKTVAGYLYQHLFPGRFKEAALHRFAGMLDHFLKSGPFVGIMRHVVDRNRRQVLEVLDPALLESDILPKALEAERLSTTEMVERRLVETAKAERETTERRLAETVESERAHAREMVRRREMEWAIVETVLRRRPAGRPATSIIIPVFNKCDFTYHCLRSLFAARVDTPYETILVDNGSYDRTSDVLDYFGSALRVIRNVENRGFVAACNQGAAEAKGDFLVFLNNDTEVTDGWLDRLVETTEVFEDAGAVGARLVYPDGTLQEAGSIVWRDASAANYGWREPPLDPKYGFLREADYCSAACLLVKRGLFERLGGFDVRYTPAYYEDTDLCFGIRSLGYKVFYQPLCEVTHYEGATGGKDVGAGFKRFQAINREKFREKWRDALRDQPPASWDTLDAVADRRTGPRILVIDIFAPRYDQDSGSHRMFNCLKALSQMGCRVSFMLRKDAEFDRYCQELGRIGVRITKEEGGEVWDDLRAGTYGLVLVSRWDIAELYLEKIKDAGPEVPVVFDTVDMHFVREMRMAELSGDRKMMEDALEIKEKELAIARASDITIAVTEVDREFLLREEPKLDVLVVPNVHPTVDVVPAVDGRVSLMFIGGYRHLPNVDAMLYFVKDMLPLIRRGLGGVELLIVGSDPPEEVQALASDKIIVTGYVPDIAPHYRKSRVFVCPLRYGAGMKGKIGEAMSHGVPVVTTTIGAEGMGLVHGETALIQDDPEAFASEVVRLYMDDALWMKLAVNGQKHISEKFGPEAVFEKLRLIKELASRGVTRR